MTATSRKGTTGMIADRATARTAPAGAHRALPAAEDAR